MCINVEGVATDNNFSVSKIDTQFGKKYPKIISKILSSGSVWNDMFFTTHFLNFWTLLRNFKRLIWIWKYVPRILENWFFANTLLTKICDKTENNYRAILQGNWRYSHFIETRHAVWDWDSYFPVVSQFFPIGKIRNFDFPNWENIGISQIL